MASNEFADKSKIVVFGSSYACRKYIANKENRDEYVRAKDIDSVRGMHIKGIVKLDGWYNCYSDPKEIMDEAEYRAEQYNNSFTLFTDTDEQQIM